MPTVRRTAVVAATPEAVWRLVADPHHFPRWWPGVTRMEGVEHERWTQVFVTRKGRPVRLDFRLLESQAPGKSPEPAARRRWEQELTGGPFERVLAEAITEVRLEPGENGTRVTIEERQRPRGYARLVGVMWRRASRTRIDRALAGLEHAVGGTG
jgi:carbon monoxide dehydrogenase subunit G